MEKETKERRIIDKRKKEKFMVDDEYLNGMARLCGWQGTIVYNSLCRHSNKDQESFPSIKLMAEQHSVGRDSIFKGIYKLEERKIIEVKKSRTKDGKWLNNTYILLDKSEWDYRQVGHTDTGSQVGVSDSRSRPHRHGRVGHTDTKETHNQGNTFKETHITCEQSSRDNGIKKLMDIFYKINPTINWGNKTTRKAAGDLIKKFGLEGTLKMAEQIIVVQGKPYAPVATTPYQMKEKLAQFKIYFDSQNNQSKILKV